MIYLICVILTVIIFFLSARIFLFQKSLKEINEEIEEILRQNLDTNALLTVSSGNRHIRKLAAQLNRQLAELRKEHLRYKIGDKELKEAITNISHDLRTPLTAICGYLDLLQKELILREQPGDTSKALHYMEIIKNRTEAMKQLTGELFRYSVALSEKEMQPVVLSLNQILEECLISFYGELSQRGITPVIKMSEQTVYRTLDAFSLKRIFSNIISNAAKYSDKDLHVTLTPEGVITFSNKTDRLTPVTTAQLFDRFYTVETVTASPTVVYTDTSVQRSFTGSEGSTGLGLSIAKLLTERMGGIIGAEYKDGELHITLQFP